MSLYTDALSYAADTTQVQAGGKSFAEEAADALTYGAGAAVASGLNSIYNTGAAVVNGLGGSADYIDTYKQLDNLDKNWASYYKEHQQGADVAGFIATSFIPGGAAVKGLNLLRTGESVGAMGRALGFARTQQALSLDKALAEMAVEGGSVFTRINKNKAASIAWGFADQTLTAAAFETGVALTMKQSPLLADDSWWDIGKSALTGAVFGGVVGGAIDGLILNKSFKNAVQALDGKHRNYDYVADIGGFNLSAGDKAYGILDSLSKLPKEVLSEDAALELSFTLTGGRAVKKSLDISKLLENTLGRTNKSGTLDLETALRELSPDSSVAQPAAEFILKKFANDRAKGMSDDLVRERIGDYLFELSAVKAATDKPLTAADDLWYFKDKVTAADLSGIKTIEDWEKAVKSSTPFTANAYKKPYMFKGTPEQKMEAFKNAASIGTEEGQFKTLGAAWAAGKDIAFMPDGALRVNDASKVWQRVNDPVYASTRFLNTKSGALSEDAVLTAADLLPAGKTLGKEELRVDSVVLARAEGAPLVLKMDSFNPAGDTQYFTARHAWASKLDDASLPTIIDVHDFSLMDRLRTVTDEEVLAGITLKAGPEHSIGSALSVSLDEVIQSAKLGKAQELFMEAHEAGKVLDTRAVAYQLNTDPVWLEQAVANRFRKATAGEDMSEFVVVAKPDQGQLSVPLDSYTRRENVIAAYNTPAQFQELAAIKPDMTWRQKRNLIMEQVDATGGQFVTGELAWGERVRAASTHLRNASGAVLGTERVALLPDMAQTAARTADSRGAGASTFGAANANYGDQLALAVQDTGKHVHTWIQQDVNDAMSAMATPAARLRANPRASTELGVVINVLRGSGDKYVWDAVDPQVLVLRELATLKQVGGEKYEAALSAAREAGKRTEISFAEKEAAEFLHAHSDLNSQRIQKRGVLNNARGFVSNMDPETVYVPPIDTTYFQHFAFVRPIEGRAFGTSEVSMLFGRNADELSKRIASVDRKNFDVVTKQETEKFFKAKELYDHDLTINEPRINSELRKTGALNNFQPEVRAENIVEDFLRWHQNQAGRLVRDSVETHYAQQFAELRKMGERYTDIATSKFAGTSRAAKSAATNPFDDYVKTALDVSKRSEYTFLHQANEFVDALGTRAYQAFQSAFGDASKGMLKYEEVNNVMNKYGLQGHYSSQEELFTANVPRDRNMIREYVSKANALLANTVLRLDFFNGVVNTISTPILLGTELASIKSLAKSDPALVGKLSELMSVANPAGGPAVPSTTKLIGNAIKNFFGAEKETLLARYQANGDVRDTLSQFHSMLDSLSLRADFQNFSTGVNKAFEKGARLTLNEQSEQFTRFVSADVMRQLTDPLVEAGKLSTKEQNAYMSVFTNRVQGNYISSQRPIIFQGVLGSAVSLFQTYSFNLMQQLLRHVENKDKRAVATLFGMQAGTFGLSGTPFFEAVNTHLIGTAAVNQGNYDSYSMAPQILGKGLGDWLMYGTASAMPAFFGAKDWPALYTRGDINPRHMSIIPINPVDIPAIDASIRVVKNVTDVGSKLAAGGNVTETLLQGLEHNGINRPLAGFAQVLNGKATTSKGSLISASNDFSAIATASRILGAKPLDEAIALNHNYRMKAYQVAERDRMEHLGEKVKSYLYNNQFPTDDVMDGFMLDYAKAGGRVENFHAALQRWSKDANTSVVEKLRGKMQSSYGQRLSEIMGGVPLSDYSNMSSNPEGAAVAELGGGS